MDFISQNSKNPRSLSPFRIGRSKSLSPKSYLVFSIDQLNQLIINFLKNILDNEDFIKNMMPIYFKMLTSYFLDHPNFMIEDENVKFTNKNLDSFKYQISSIFSPQMIQNNGIMLDLYKTYSEDEDYKSRLGRKLEREFDNMVEQIKLLLEENLKAPITFIESKNDINFKVEISSLDNPNVDFFVIFLEKRDLGILFYSMYIQSMNENVCVPIYDLDEMIKEIKRISKEVDDWRLYDYKLPEYHKSSKEKLYWKCFGILLEDGVSEIIMRNNDKLTVTKKFENNFNHCLNYTDKRFIVSFFNYRMPNCHHMNILIYDRKLNEIERFEPELFTESNCPNEKADELLEKYFNGLGMKYIPPINFCPNIGIQRKYEGDLSERDQIGFCVTWSFLYANERLLHPELSRKEVIDTMEKRLRKKFEKYTSFDLYFKDRISQILSYFQKDVDKINQELGTKYYIDGRTLRIKF
jgi:hypothetical protein